MQKKEEAVAVVPEIGEFWTRAGDRGSLHGAITIISIDEGRGLVVGWDGLQDVGAVASAAGDDGGVKSVGRSVCTLWPPDRLRKSSHKAKCRATSP